MVVEWCIPDVFTHQSNAERYQEMVKINLSHIQTLPGRSVAEDVLKNIEAKGEIARNWQVLLLPQWLHLYL